MGGEGGGGRVILQFEVKNGRLFSGESGVGGHLFKENSIYIFETTDAF